MPALNRAVAALLLTGLAGCASTRFIEPTQLELGHAPGPDAAALGEDGYLQVQVSSNLGENAERLKFYGSDAPKLIIVTAKLQPLAGPGRSQPAPEVPLLSYDVSKATSEDLTARTLGDGIVVKAGSLSGAATLTLIVRGITESGAATLQPMMETIKKTPSAITGVATLLGGVPITAFQTLVVPMLEKSATSPDHQWQKKKEYTFQVGERLDELDGRVIAFLLLMEDRKGPPVQAELCSLSLERPRLCVARGDGVDQPLTTPYLLFDLRLSDYRPIDDLVPQGGACSSDRGVLAKTADAIASGALTQRQGLLEALVLARRNVLAEVRESGGSIDRLSRAAWHYQRLTTPAPDSPRYAYWQQRLALRNQRVDECINEALAAASLNTRRRWTTLLDGFRAIETVEDAVQRNADADVPDAADAAKVEAALRKLNTAEAIPAIDAESHAYLVAGVSNAASLLERHYREQALRITGSGAPDAAAELKKLIAATRCTSCVAILNTALASVQSGAGARSTEAAIRREGLVVDAVKAGARIDAANGVGSAPAGSARAVQAAVSKGLAVEPDHEGAASTLDSLHDRVENQRDQAAAALNEAAPAPAP